VAIDETHLLEGLVLDSYIAQTRRAHGQPLVVPDDGGNHSAIDQQSISNQSAIDPQSISNQSAINQPSISNQSAINQQSISNRSAIDQQSISNRSAIAQHRQPLVILLAPAVVVKEHFGRTRVWMLDRHDAPRVPLAIELALERSAHDGVRVVHARAHDGAALALCGALFVCHLEQTVEELLRLMRAAIKSPSEALRGTQRHSEAT
jgi:hypothetical protein